MNKTHVTIYILPMDEELLGHLEILKGYSKSKVGKVLSTKDELNVNAVQDGFSIIFKDEDIEGELDFNCLISNIIAIFINNISNPNLYISVSYLYEIEGNSDDWYFDTDVAISVMKICDTISYVSQSIPKNADYNVQYEPSISIKEMMEDYKACISENSDGDDEDDFYQSLGNINVQDKENVLSIISDVIGDNSNLSDDSNDKKKNHKKKEYDSSKSLKTSKKPKKYYKRHGILIAPKSSIKHDEKIIKDFIKDFIPGSAGWKREFRKNLLERWIKSFALSSSQVKKLEKKHKKRMNKLKNVKYNKRTSMDIVNKVLTEPIDQWYNPRR